MYYETSSYIHSNFNLKVKLDIIDFILYQAIESVILSPLGVFLTSFRYWANFVASDVKVGSVTIGLKSLRNRLDSSKFKTSLIFSFVKCCIVSGMTFLISVVLENETYVSEQIRSTEPWSWNRYTEIAHLVDTSILYKSSSKNM